MVPGGQPQTSAASSWESPAPASGPARRGGRARAIETSDLDDVAHCRVVRRRDEPPGSTGRWSGAGPVRRIWSTTTRRAIDNSHVHGPAGETGQRADHPQVGLLDSVVGAAGSTRSRDGAPHIASVALMELVGRRAVTTPAAGPGWWRILGGSRRVSLGDQGSRQGSRRSDPVDGRTRRGTFHGVGPGLIGARIMLGPRSGRTMSYRRRRRAWCAAGPARSSSMSRGMTCAACAAGWRTGSTSSTVCTRQ